MTDLISKEKAWEFINGKLQITDAKNLLERNQLDFLNKVVYTFHHTIPYHNFVIVSLPFEERTCPDVEQNIKYVLDGIGGICWNVNSAMFHILKAIGLEVMPIIASIRPCVRNHLMVVTRDVVKKGDKYLLEFGLGESSFSAMCLDFEGDESENWNESFRTHKIVREGNFYKHFVRSRVPKNDENPWKLQYDFMLEPVDVEEARENVKTSFYENPSHNQSLGPRAVTFRDGKLIAMKQKILLKENSDHKLEATEIENDEDVIETMKLYFPIIKSETVKKALEQMVITEEKYGKRGPMKGKTHVLQV